VTALDCGTATTTARPNIAEMPAAAPPHSVIERCRAEAVSFKERGGVLSTHAGAFCISNPHLPDCPITYANATFCEQTGYSLEECAGHNCRFLQCSATDRSTIGAMRTCVASMCLNLPASKAAQAQKGGAMASSFRIVNVKKDGTRFLNLVHMAPLYNSQGKLVRCVRRVETHQPTTPHLHSVKV
jgi:PAS domain-containing protein